MLEWGRRYVPEAGPFARTWLESHLNRDTVSPYSGHRSRPARAGGIPITTYAGQFGLCFPCYEIFTQSKDERARRVCIELADIILHEVARNRYGLVAHDDTAEFAIPDTCYFAVSALILASALDRTGGAVYRRQAVFQLRTYTDTFLMPDTGLAKTILLKDGLGKTYWTRATGWLLWSITSVLGHLPPEDPAFAGFVRDVRKLADGISRVQDESGGLRLFMNEPDSPLETTGTAMCAMGLHEAIRRRWLPASYTPVVERAWRYVTGNITPEGDIRRAYTGWAVPAENHEVELDQRKMGWIPGFILSTAYELTAAGRT
jgi:rhamnogalacturonyl hydrolase YesR